MASNESTVIGRRIHAYLRDPLHDHPAFHDERGRNSHAPIDTLVGTVRDVVGGGLLIEVESVGGIGPERLPARRILLPVGKIDFAFVE